MAKLYNKVSTLWNARVGVEVLTKTGSHSELVNNRWSHYGNCSVSCFNRTEWHCLIRGRAKTSRTGFSSQLLLGTSIDWYDSVNKH